MRKLTRFLRPYKIQLALGPFFKLLEAVIDIVLPILMARIINIGIKGNDQDYIVKTGLIMAGLALFGWGFAVICQYFASVTSQGFGTAVRNSLFAHIGRFSPTEMERCGASSLTTRITNDVNQLQTAVAMLIRLAIRAPLLCIGGLIASMMIDFQLSLVILAGIVVFGLIFYLVIGRTSPLYRLLQKKLDTVGLTLRENLSGVRVIRAFAREDSEKDRFDGVNDDYSATAKRIGKLSALTNPLTTLVLNLVIISILLFGGVRINAGGLEQGEVVAIISYVTQILTALTVLANLIVLFTKAAASAGRVAEVFDTRPGITFPTEEKDSSNASSFAVEFENISFGYNLSGEYAVKDISFSVRPGETVGVIGGTGSGKSTLLNLIPRFYDPQQGIVRVLGQDVKDRTQSFLRTRIGIVPQKTELFSGTIAENLRFGNQSAPDEELHRAAETAQAAEFIDKLKNGYDTRVERGGANLSGGQKQRLAIARALVLNPDILILDDSASALDFATDAKLRRALRQNTRGMTVFIISQRASSVRDCDKIAVLDEGMLEGIGTHSELYETCKTYRDICLSQLNEEEAAGHVRKN